MVLDCFDGLTGLANTCDAYAASPAVPLEDFGIDETLIAQFIGPEDTVASFLYGAEQQARLTIKTDILSKHAARIIPRTFLHSERVGEPDGHQTLVTGATGRNGILVEVNQRAANTRLALTGWRFYAAVTESVTLTIYDLADGSAVDTVTIAATADILSSGGVDVTIPLPRRAGRFFIAHDRPTYRLQQVDAGCSSCTGGAYRYGGVLVTGASLPAATPMVRSNLRTGSRTGGLSVVVDVACDHSQYLCEAREMFTGPYVSKVIEVLLRRGINAVERMNTQRINLDLLKTRADRAGEEYAASMTNLMSGMVLPCDDVCFTCAKYARVVTSAP
jgi:hypothetical protein